MTPLQKLIEWTTGFSLGQKPRAETLDISADLSSETIRDFFRTGSATGSGVTITETTALKVASYFRCLQINSGALANMSADLVERVSETERRPAVGHPLRRTLTVKPNQWQTPGEFKKLMQLWLLQRGNAYARKVKVGRDVVAVIPIHPQRVFAEQLDNGTMRYRVSPKNGMMETLTGAEIMHIRGMSLDGVCGVPVLRYMSEALGISTAAEMAAGRMMRTGNMAGGAIEVPREMTDETFARLEETMAGVYGGSGNAGKWMILEDGATAKPFSLTAEELQFLGVRDFQRYDIAAFMGVPPYLIGATEKSTSWGSGIEQQAIAYLTYTVLDWVKAWEESIKRDLIDERDWERLDFRFYTASLARADMKTRTESYKAGLQWGWLSPDEVRAFEDMNPRGDGRGEMYYDPPGKSAAAQTETSDRDVTLGFSIGDDA
jgi:HK97 family phage portal protein